MLKTGNWLIVAGALFMFGALCTIPSALMKNAEVDMLALGGSLFSFGALLIAGGMYLKARALQSKGPASDPAKTPRRIRGGCDLCGTESPVINCKVHQLHLCGDCLAMHYDFRSCAYVPSTRRASKSGSRTSPARMHSA